MLNYSGTGYSTIGAYRILVIDDDPALLTLVADSLRRDGFEVFKASSGQQALKIIEQHGFPHLAIVDIMMPVMDGFEFCRIVQQVSDLPVIMLTAIDQEEIVIRGLEHFAEDYVTKPFSPRELAARVKRVLRRIGEFSYALDQLVVIDERLSIDFMHQQVRVDNISIALTPIETKLLYLLIRNAGKITSTDFLLRRLWPLKEVFEDTLRVHIHRLRQKVEANPAEPHYIVTERGTGYLFPKKH